MPQGDAGGVGGVSPVEVCIQRWDNLDNGVSLVGHGTFIPCVRCGTGKTT